MNIKIQMGRLAIKAYIRNRSRFPNKLGQSTGQEPSVAPKPLIIINQYISEIHPTSDERAGPFPKITPFAAYRMIRISVLSGSW
jgi:hypothetical protein